MRRFKRLPCLLTEAVIKIRQSYTLPHRYYFLVNGVMQNGFFTKSGSRWYWIHTNHLYYFKSLSDLFSFAGKELLKVGRA